MLSAVAPSHAYLFHGPGGAGKRQRALEFAADLLSEGDDGARSRVLANAHPDLTWVAPSGAHEVLVADIDGPVVAAATRTPFEAQRRVFVIESADQLGEEAANRMLKTLEEPASFVHIILITDRLGDMVATIRSRCQLVRFDGPDVEQLAAEVGQACALLSLGDAGVARELASEDGAALRDAAEGFVVSVLGGRAALEAPWEPVLAAVKARGERTAAELEAQAAAELEVVSRKDRRRVEKEWDDRAKRVRRRTETGALAQVLTLIETWLLDLAALGWGAGEQVRNVDRPERLRSLAGPDPAALLRAVGAVEETRVHLPLNVSEPLALEALAYTIGREL
ncbi:MAG: hypothetical protein J2O48_08040 [Solirubrobacterales bacterium]|nr:hypothetical protein [Solirubrobacterales bacterium]